VTTTRRAGPKTVLVVELLDYAAPLHRALHALLAEADRHRAAFAWTDAETDLEAAAALTDMVARFNLTPPAEPHPAAYLLSARSGSDGHGLPPLPGREGGAK
jgi:hypothetical protein